MVIDPGDEIQNILGLVQKHNLQVKQIVITHAHIDHVGGAMKLRAVTGAPILLNQNDYDLLKMLDIQATWIGVAPPGKMEIDQNIGQSDTVKAGSLTANVLFTPGHTEGSVCLYFPAEKRLIAGDTLLPREGLACRKLTRPWWSAFEETITDSLHGKLLCPCRDDNRSSSPAMVQLTDHHWRGTREQSIPENPSLSLTATLDLATQGRIN